MPAGTPTFSGKTTARPAILSLRLPFSISSVSGFFPTRNLKIGVNDSSEVATWTWVWFGIVTFCAPPISLVGSSPGSSVRTPAQIASVSTRPGGKSLVRPSMLT